MITYRILRAIILLSIILVTFSFLWIMKAQGTLAAGFEGVVIGLSLAAVLLRAGRR